MGVGLAAAFSLTTVGDYALRVVLSLPPTYRYGEAAFAKGGGWRIVPGTPVEVIETWFVSSEVWLP
jgi:hypothetical protein